MNYTLFKPHQKKALHEANPQTPSYEKPSRSAASGSATAKVEWGASAKRMHPIQLLSWRDCGL